jgi:uncharacterized protein (DUF362 family)
MKVAIFRDPELAYPGVAPFGPGEVFPELRSLPYAVVAGPTNPVYAAVREGFRLLGLDRARVGSDAWNPLTGIARQGDRIVVKPNLVLHEVPTLLGSQAVFTHASVLRPLIDYLLLATGGEADIVVADCPLQEADLGTILRASGLQAVLDFYKAMRAPIRFLDFRVDRIDLRDGGFIADRKRAEGDPRGNVTMRVDAESALEPITRGEDRFGSAYQQGFAVANYDPARTAVHHAPGRHEYLIPRTVLDADLFVNVPKLKTHQKAGITVCQKNLIGINADKSYLPHYREGSADEGGDEYPHRHWLTTLNRTVRKKMADGNVLAWTVGSRLWRAAKATVLSPSILGRDASFVRNAQIGGGAWHGNDTIWRTILDVNRILFFGDAEGRLNDEPQRRYFTIVDGIVGGDRNGPILPRPRASGVLLFGDDPLAVDVVAARLMGFEWRLIPQLYEASRMDQHPYSAFRGNIDALSICSNDPFCNNLFDRTEHLGFDPPPFWEPIRLVPGSLNAGANAMPSR